ncbi:hypothetical protein DFH06DRAFT_1155218 [Mycena polygramma]|nr:hypothetical protein DFH06DRAFT_1155218 [Mycena polygramma]
MPKDCTHEQEAKLEAKIEKLNQENEHLKTELSESKLKATQSSQAAKAYFWKIHEMYTDMHRACGTLNVRTTLEVYASVYRLKAELDPSFAHLRIAPGVQPVLDAMANGSFDRDIPEAFKFAPNMRAAYANTAIAEHGLTEEEYEQGMRRLYEDACQLELEGHKYPDSINKLAHK